MALFVTLCELIEFVFVSHCLPLVTSSHCCWLFTGSAFMTGPTWIFFLCYWLDGLWSVDIGEKLLFLASVLVEECREHAESWCQVELVHRKDIFRGNRNRSVFKRAIFQTGITQCLVMVFWNGEFCTAQFVMQLNMQHFNPFPVTCMLRKDKTRAEPRFQRLRMIGHWTCHSRRESILRERDLFSALVVFDFFYSSL